MEGPHCPHMGHERVKAYQSLLMDKKKCWSTVGGGGCWLVRAASERDTGKTAPILVHLSIASQRQLLDLPGCHGRRYQL
jgi:hypothetical protein